MVRSLANDRNIVIKKADKGSFVVIWARSDYIMEAEKQLNEKTIYRMLPLTRTLFQTSQKRVIKSSKT